MNKTMKIIIIIALIMLVGIVIAIKQQNRKKISVPATTDNSNPAVTAESKSQNPETPTTTETTASLPRLVDLGAGKCIPCKMMAPILDELKSQYQGKMDVIFVDVWEKPDEAKKYKINIIPTQIFFDASGKELYRHEGFFSKENILAKWNEFGIILEKGVNNETN